jgi:hypothetical protein
VEVFDYRGAVPDTGASTVHRLGDRPVAARDALLASLQVVTEAESEDRRLRAAPAGRAATAARTAV